jgi:hypothetical protein
LEGFFDVYPSEKMKESILRFSDIEYMYKIMCKREESSSIHMGDRERRGSQMKMILHSSDMIDLFF